MNLMKTPRSWSAFILIALVLVVAGCVPKRIVWSPDGKLAAVLGDNGLYLCDPAGKLSDMLVPDVHVVEWFADSRRLALVREVKYKSWAEVQPLLSAEDRDRITRSGQAVFDKLKAGTEFNAALASVPDGSDKTLACVYLKSIDGVKALAGQNWSFLEGTEVESDILQVGTVTDGKVTLGPPLVTGLRKIVELRIAPNASAIAYAVESGEKDDISLKVVPVDGSQPSQLVAEHAAWYPDWSADGRSLVYINTVGPAPGGDKLQLGSLARRGLLNAAGKIELQAGQDELAGLLTFPYNKVRCLGDGRIIFSAADVRLPCTALDMPERQQLYCLDPQRQATLTPLIPQSVQSSVPEMVCFFEVSPDGKRISIGGKEGDVVVLTLATGEVETVQPRITGSGGQSDHFNSVPVWRSTNELCFVSVQSTNNVNQPGQIVLHENGNTRTLSTAWPAELRKGWLDN